MSDAAGAGARLAYTVETKSKGKGLVSLKYWQSWSGEDSVEKRLSFQVEVS
jgi:hypothetical protein